MSAPTIAYYQVRWRPTGSNDAWQTENFEPGKSNIVITGIQIGTDYTIQARSVSTCGMASDWATAAHTALPGTDGPPIITSVTAAQLGGGIEFNLEFFTTPPAGMVTQVHHAPDVSGSPGTFTDTGKRFKGHTFTLADDGSAEGWFKFRTQDNRGNVSPFSSSINKRGKVVADGADVTMDQLAGFGVNVVPAAYAVFVGSSLPKLILAGCTASLTTAAGSTSKFAQSLRLTVTDISGQIRCDFTSSVSNKLNIPLKSSKKWIYSGDMKASHSARTVILRLLSDPSTAIASTSSLAVPTAIDTVTGVIDCTGHNNTSASLRISLNGGGWQVGETLDINYNLLELQVGNLTTPSNVSQPGVATIGDVPDDAADSGRVATAVGTTANQPAAGNAGALYHATDAGTNGTTYRDTGAAWKKVGVGHLGDADGSLDNVGDGSTYGKPLLSRLSSGKPLIDFAEGIHLNKNVDNVADGSTYARTLASRVSSGKPWVDLSESINTNKTLQYITDYSGGSRYAVSAIDAARKALIDFSQAGHTNKNLDNVADGSTYARTLASRVSSGKPFVDLSESINLNRTLQYISDDFATSGRAATAVGILSARPSAGTAGRLYHATDSGTNGTTFRDTGSVWKKVGIGHLGDADGNLDNVGDGSTYARPLASRLSSGKPFIDFSESINLNKNLDNIADTATYGRVNITALTSGNVDLSKAGVTNKTLDNIADSATYGRVKLSSLTSGQVDLSLNGVLNRNTSMLTDDAGLGNSAVFLNIGGFPTTVHEIGITDAMTTLGAAAGNGYVFQQDSGGAPYLAPKFDETFDGYGDTLADTSTITTALAVWGGKVISVPNPGAQVTILAWLRGFVADDTANVNTAKWQLEYSTDGGSTWTAPNSFLLASVPATLNYRAPVADMLCINNVTPTGDVQIRARIALNSGTNSMTFTNGVIAALVIPNNEGSSISGALTVSVPATAAGNCSQAYITGNASPVTTCTATKNVKATPGGGVSPFTTYSWAVASGTGTITAGSALKTVTISDTETTSDVGATHTTTINCTVTDSQSYVPTAGSDSANVATVTIGAHSIPANAVADISGCTPAGYNKTGATVTAVTGTAIKYATATTPGAMTVFGMVNNVRVTSGNCVITNTFTRTYNAIGGTMTETNGDCSSTGSCTASGFSKANPTGGNGSYTYSHSIASQSGGGAATIVAGSTSQQCTVQDSRNPTAGATLTDTVNMQCAVNDSRSTGSKTLAGTLTLTFEDNT